MSFDGGSDQAETGGGGIVFGETDISDIFIKINLAIRWSKHGGVI